MKTKTLELISKRRSQYALGRNTNIGEADIAALVTNVVRQSPSPFNSQSSRAVVLFGEQNQQLWNMVRTALLGVTPEDGVPAMESKIASFSAGCGTVLFFEDADTVQGLQDNFPLYADNFPAWSEQSSGMAQFAVWTALAEIDIGASLQHYNPLIDQAVTETWGVPGSWRLRAQMPFGSNEGPYKEKTFIDDAERFRVIR